MPAGRGIYRAHIQSSYRPRPLPPDDLDVPYESWSQEDQKNPASEDFWERITITLESDPDAIVDAAPFQLPPADVVPATGGMPPADELTSTDRTGAQRPILDVEMGSQEWLEPVAAGESGQPSIMGQGDRMWLITGLQWERPMLLPANACEVPEYVAPSIYTEVGNNGRIVYGRRSDLPPEDPRYQTSL